VDTTTAERVSQATVGERDVQERLVAMGFDGARILDFNLQSSDASLPGAVPALRGFLSG